MSRCEQCVSSRLSCEDRKLYKLPPDELCGQPRNFFSKLVHTAHDFAVFRIHKRSESSFGNRRRSELHFFVPRSQPSADSNTKQPLLSRYFVWSTRSQHIEKRDRREKGYERKLSRRKKM